MLSSHVIASSDVEMDGEYAYFITSVPGIGVAFTHSFFAFITCKA